MNVINKLFSFMLCLLLGVIGWAIGTILLYAFALAFGVVLLAMIPLSVAGKMIEIFTK